MNETYREKMIRLAKRATRKGNTLEARYYQERIDGTACVSYEQFIGSWAGQEWLKKQG